MASQKDIRNQLKQLQLHRNNLQWALEQSLRQGGRAFENSDIQGRIDEARAGIARCKKILDGWGVKVEDLPDDLQDDLLEDLPPIADTMTPPAQPVDGGDQQREQANTVATTAQTVVEAEQQTEQTNTVATTAQSVGEANQQGGRAGWPLVHLLIGVIGVAIIAGGVLVWPNGQKDQMPASAQSAAGSQTSVSAPSQALPTYDLREAAYGAATSAPAGGLFDPVSPSPEAPPNSYDPTEEALLWQSASAEASVPTKAVATAQPAVRPPIPAATATAVPTTQSTTIAAALPVPAKMEPTAAVTPLCGPASSGKAVFIDTFADGSIENEQRKVVVDSRVVVTVDNGYLRVTPKETIKNDEPALFYRTKFHLKNFCSVLFVSNFTGEKGSVSLSFRYTERKENEENKYKYYSFWVSVLGYIENRYYVQKAMKGAPWEFVQNKEGPLPSSVQDVSTLSVSCYDSECSFFVNGIKITNVVGGIDEEAGEIRFYMKGDIGFDVSRVEIYER
ncbi:MAG: hypothetical protein OHK0022_43110 [Roseiflexaceae bacterium]